MDKQKNHCKSLRAKNAYGTMEGGDSPFLPVDAGTTTYWCLKTCSPVGPDNQPAYTRNCGAHRPCFQSMVKEENLA